MATKAPARTSKAESDPALLNLGKLLDAGAIQIADLSPDVAAYFNDRQYGNPSGGVGVNAEKMHPEFARRLQLLVDAAEAATGDKVQFAEGYRDPKVQAQYRANFLNQDVTYNGVTYHNNDGPAKYRAAKPEESEHQKGMAVDLRVGPNPTKNPSGPAFEYMVKHAADYGIHWYGSDDPAHFEMPEAEYKAFRKGVEPTKFAVRNPDGLRPPGDIPSLDTAVGSMLDTTRPTSHTIKKGDTLSAIAKANGTTVAEIAKINGIKNPNKVPIGTKLELPSAATTPKAWKQSSIDTKAGIVTQRGNNLTPADTQDLRPEDFAGFPGGQRSDGHTVMQGMENLLVPKGAKAYTEPGADVIPPTPRSRPAALNSQPAAASSAPAKTSAAATPPAKASTGDAKTGMGGLLTQLSTVGSFLGSLPKIISGQPTQQPTQKSTAVAPAQTPGAAPSKVSQGPSGGAASSQMSKVGSIVAGGVANPMSPNIHGLAALVGAGGAAHVTPITTEKKVTATPAPSKTVTKTESAAPAIDTQAIGNAFGNFLGGIGTKLSEGVETLKSAGTTVVDNAGVAIESAKKEAVQWVMTTPAGRGAVIDPMIAKLFTNDPKHIGANNRTIAREQATAAKKVLKSGGTQAQANKASASAASNSSERGQNALRESGMLDEFGMITTK